MIDGAAARAVGWTEDPLADSVSFESDSVAIACSVVVADMWILRKTGDNDGVSVSLGYPTRRILLAIALAGAGAVGVKELRNRPASGNRTVPVATKTRLGRNRDMAKLGSRAGADLAVTKARQVFASAERSEELQTEFELRTAEQVTAALGNMKGAMMKVGQMASYLDQGLPEHVRDALAQLQSDAPPMSFELVDGVIAEELGAPAGEVFEEFDPVPIASASIGQVHRAMTRDGRAVAVKVQYPGVDEAIDSDLDNLDMLFGGMGMVFNGLDPEPLVIELKARLREELDYIKEAENQRRFADYYRGHPHVTIPEVVDEHCSARVLTTELAEGVRWAEMLTWSQEEKNLAAECIYRYAFTGLYRVAAFNGDPHPGNYLFQPGGRVTFLDYGLVKHFEGDTLEAFGEMIGHMCIEPNVSLYRKSVERLGLLRPGHAFTDEEVGDYFGHFYEFVLQDGEFTITDAYASETVRRFFDVNGPYRDIQKAANVPPDFVVIQRINLGLFALFGELDATANWRSIAEEIWPFVEGPPSTPLGAAHARWAESVGGR